MTWPLSARSVPKHLRLAVYQKGAAASKLFEETIGAIFHGELATKASLNYHHMTRPTPCLPSHQESRLLDLRYQCALSAKKCYVLRRLHEFLYVEKRNHRPRSTLITTTTLTVISVPEIARVQVQVPVARTRKHAPQSRRAAASERSERGHH